MVRCKGQTIIKVVDSVGAQTPFDAIFRIEGDSVTMIEGDFFRFAKDYLASTELTRPGRPGYKSDRGNLFFFLDSGRFQIFRLDHIVDVGLKTESTTGDCTKFDSSGVFK